MDNVLWDMQCLSHTGALALASVPDMRLGTLHRRPGNERTKRLFASA